MCSNSQANCPNKGSGLSLTDVFWLADACNPGTLELRIYYLRITIARIRGKQHNKQHIMEPEYLV